MAKQRFEYRHAGLLIYEWEQSLEEVNIYIYPPRDISASMLNIVIDFNSVVVGLKGSAPFISEQTAGIVKVIESTWTFQDGELNICLQKMKKGELWEFALKGHSSSSPNLNSADIEILKKQFILERFQQEVCSMLYCNKFLLITINLTYGYLQHPGFDFSNADIYGKIPDAREFMGGIKK